MRLTEKGEVYVIEANPNPWLSTGAEFAMAASKSGRSYTQLIGEIVDLARGRYAGIGTGKRYSAAAFAARTRRPRERFAENDARNPAGLPGRRIGA